MDGARESHSLLDEDGNLFGVVNVVDAMVVVLVLAILVAGGSLLLQPTEKQQGPTRYATVSYTVPLDSSAVGLSAGETLDPVRGGDALNVTDVHRSFARNGSGHVVARVSYHGPMTVSDQQHYGGESFDVTARSYRMPIALLAVDQDVSTLETRPVSVTIGVNGTVARTLSAQQQIRFRDTTIGTVTAVGQSKTGAWNTPVTLRLVGWERDTGVYFGGTSLRVGNHVTVVTDEAVVSGPIRDVDRE